MSRYEQLIGELQKVLHEFPLGLSLKEAQAVLIQAGVQMGHGIVHTYGSSKALFDSPQSGAGAAMATQSGAGAPKGPLPGGGGPGGGDSPDNVKKTGPYAVSLVKASILLGSK